MATAFKQKYKPEPQTRYVALKTLALVTTAAFVAIKLLFPAVAGLQIAMAILLSGIPLISCLRTKWTLLEFWCSGMVLACPVWGISALVAWAFHGQAVSVVIGLMTICTLVTFVQPRKWIAVKWTRRDITAVTTSLVVLIPMALVYFNNGPTSQGGQQVFNARLYVHEDTFFLFSLAQQAANNKSYPLQNPIILGPSNRYPALLHCGLAGLSELGSQPVAMQMWHVFPLLVFPGVLLGFLVVTPRAAFRPRTITLAAMLYSAFLLIRVDHFMYLQTQGMAFGILALAIKFTPSSRSPFNWIIFTLLAVLLHLSHTVTSVIPTVLTGAIFLVEIGRRRRIISLYAAISLVIQITAFIIMNNYKDAGTRRDMITSDYIINQLLSSVVPYIIPIFLLFLLCYYSRPRSAYVLASVLLVLVSCMYWSYGFSATSQLKLFFTTFNASRFAVLALWLVISSVNTSRQSFAVACTLLIYALCIPVPIVRTTIGFITDSPLQVTQKQATAMARAGKEMAPGLGVITDCNSLTASTFMGRPSYFIGNWSYALGLISERQIDERFRLNSKFFVSMSPNERIEFMKINYIGAIATCSKRYIPLLPKEKSKVDTVDGLTIAVLKP